MKQYIANAYNAGRKAAEAEVEANGLEQAVRVAASFSNALDWSVRGYRDRVQELSK